MISESKGFPNQAGSDSRCLLAGGQQPWPDLIPLIFVSVLLPRLRRARAAARWLAFQGERGECGEVVAAVPCDRQCGSPEARMAAALRGGQRERVAAGAVGREARSHLAGAAGRACRAWAQGELLRGLALLRARGHQLQKKACSPASRIGPTSPDGALNGRTIRAGLIRRAWSSSTRLGPRPT